MTRQPRRRLWPAATLTAASLATGIYLLGVDTGTDAPPRPSTEQRLLDAPRRIAGEVIGSGPAAKQVPVRPMAASPPVRIRIPSIGVDAPLTGLSLLPDNTLDTPPPDEKNLAGWYTGGTQPGATGTALIAGHVDTRQGPAVFYDLGALKKDSTVEILRADGTTARFVVDGTELYDRDAFPDDKVYAPAARPELRLITCGGTYSKATGYRANTVVYAHLAGPAAVSTRR